MVTLFVLAYLYNSDGAILLARRLHQSFGAGMYSLVGGKVESGEAALKAVRREVLE